MNMCPEPERVASIFSPIIPTYLIYVQGQPAFDILRIDPPKLSVSCALRLGRSLQAVKSCWTTPGKVLGLGSESRKLYLNTSSPVQEQDYTDIRHPQSRHNPLNTGEKASARAKLSVSSFIGAWDDDSAFINNNGSRV